MLPMVFAEDVPKDSSAKSTSLIVIPMIDKSEETSWRFGVAGIYLFPEKFKDANRSNIFFSGNVSVNKQFIFSNGVEVYTDSNNYKWAYKVEGWLWPTEFYAQTQGSPEDFTNYTHQGFKNILSVLKRVKGKFYIGPKIKQHWQSNDYDQGSLLDLAPVNGKGGFSGLGLGLVARIDKRDNPNAAHEGYLLNAEYMSSVDLKNDNSVYHHTSQKYNHYFPIMFDKNIMATSIQTKFSFGDVPYNEYSTADGVTHLRGLKKFRYWDDHLFTAQIEYRRMWGNLLGIGPWMTTLYYETGKVFSDADSFQENNFNHILGFGLRYVLIPKERISLRFDFSYTEESVRVVINAIEAF